MAKAAAKVPSQEIVEQKAAAGSATSVGAALDLTNLEQDAGAGLEGVGFRDKAVPFYTILQAGSPQVNEANAGYITGAKAGMIMNTVTGEIVDRNEGIWVLACGFESKINEWVPREGAGGGGFVAAHSVDTPLMKQTHKNDKKQDTLPSGNILMLTNAHYVLRLMGEGATEQGIVAMASTQLKYSRKWNSIMAAQKLDGTNGKFTPASFTFAYHLTTMPEQKGENAWFSWEVTIGDMPTQREYDEALLFAKEFRAGKVVAATATLSASATAGGRTEDDEIPY